MNIFSKLRLSALALCSFFFTPSYGQAEKDYFITVWDLSLDKTKNTSIEFYSLSAGDVNYTWETIPLGQSGSGKFSSSETLVTIPNLPASKSIKLKLAPQNLKRFYFSLYYSPKLIDVSQWGTVVWSSMQNAFVYCFNLNISAFDLPNLSTVKTIKSMFSCCYKLNGPANINQWNTQNVTDMRGVFDGTSIFNQPIGNWNTANVTDLSGMFHKAKTFNQPIENWNTANVTNMADMFWNASSFNQPIQNWNTGKVTDMESMFSHAKSFNQQIGNWNTEKVTDIHGIFSGATSFNQPIGNWNTENVTDMNITFYGATSFNQPIGNWSTGSVINMSSIFSGAGSFNQPIGNWNTGKVTSMAYMFSGATSFNQPIGNWNTANVVNLSLLFYKATSFNQPIGNWNIASVIYMYRMFEGATNFNQPIGNWNTGNVVSMTAMFSGAISFNQSIGNWNIGSVPNSRDMISGMLDSCGIDCKTYSYTLIGWANNSNTPINKEFGAAGLKYSPLAQAARDILAKPVAQGGKGWTISGDELSTADCGIITAHQEGETQSQLSIYPNPTQDKLYLKNATTGTAYKIIDGLGRQVITDNCQNEEISIAALPSGLYTLICGTRHFTFVKE